MLYIFDWDGTLMDSTHKIVTCVSKAIDDLDWEFKSYSQIEGIIGLSLPEAVASLYPDSSAADINVLQQCYIEHFIEADRNPCTLFPGVEGVLLELRERGHQLAVATGKSRKGLSRVLDGVGWSVFFDATRCADETRSKPHPLMLNEILNELSFSAGDAVMVGDTEFDLAMAVRAGMRSVGVSYGAHSVERLQAHSPVMLMDHFTELLGFQGKI
jgi:phosphoglycolate phosphatase